MVVLFLLLLLVPLLPFDRQEVVLKRELDVLRVHAWHLDLHDQAVLGLRDVHVRCPIAKSWELIPAALEQTIEHAVHLLPYAAHSCPWHQTTHSVPPPFREANVFGRPLRPHTFTLAPALRAVKTQDVPRRSARSLQDRGRIRGILGSPRVDGWSTDLSCGRAPRGLCLRPSPGPYSRALPWLSGYEAKSSPPVR